MSVSKRVGTRVGSYARTQRSIRSMAAGPAVQLTFADGVLCLATACDRCPLICRAVAGSGRSVVPAAATAAASHSSPQTVAIAKYAQCLFLAGSTSRMHPASRRSDCPFASKTAPPSVMPHSQLTRIHSRTLLHVVIHTKQASHCQCLVAWLPTQFACRQLACSLPLRLTSCTERTSWLCTDVPASVVCCAV